MVKRFMVYETEDEGVQKPCVVVSPNELNNALPYVMIAPIISHIRPLPYRVMIEMKGRDAQIALDKLRTIRKTALMRKIGILPENSHQEISHILTQMFTL